MDDFDASKRSAHDFSRDMVILMESFFTGSFWSAMVSYVALSVVKVGRKISISIKLGFSEMKPEDSSTSFSCLLFGDRFTTGNGSR